MLEVEYQVIHAVPGRVRLGSISPLQPLNQVFMSSYFESLARKQF
ncbi:hypothetical protein [Microcystis aeruginosa]|nr:hypothetical protein [Microcystis aeruginosa]MDB9397915.1 hypothetical protein [Microcystis aeruginosa CS-573]